MATFFSTIQKDKFAVQHSWEEISPYNQPEESQFDGQVYCFIATSGNTSFTVTQDYYTKRHSADWVIYKGSFPHVDWERILRGCKTRKPYAKFYFTDKRKQPDAAEQELAYLFQHLTGLPGSLYRIESDFKPDGALEAAGRISVVGNRQAVKLLSP